ncbi:unnamed protein product [Arabidopsis lyrata]|nr:unnamed protein product [Arabidopsis lyrata]
MFHSKKKEKKKRERERNKRSAAGSSSSPVKARRRWICEGRFLLGFGILRSRCGASVFGGPGLGGGLPLMSGCNRVFARNFVFPPCLVVLLAVRRRREGRAWSFLLCDSSSG